MLEEDEKVMTYIDCFYDDREAGVLSPTSDKHRPLSECFRGVDMWKGGVRKFPFLPDRQIHALKILLNLSKFRRTIYTETFTYIYFRCHHQERSSLFK